MLPPLSPDTASGPKNCLQLRFAHLLDYACMLVGGGGGGWQVVKERDNLTLDMNEPDMSDGVTNGTYIESSEVDTISSVRPHTTSCKKIL